MDSGHSGEMGLADMLEVLCSHKDGGYLIACEATEGAGHAVGLVRVQSGKLILFLDPNVGEYRVNRISEFFREYVKLRAQAMGLRFRDKDHYSLRFGIVLDV